ncbi:MAG: hypothetical protein L0H94_11790 [Nitrospira sp.]|nr:hypothetical protein [Nitrospira sp.]
MHTSLFRVIEILVVGCASFLVACALPLSVATPSTWEPRYWDEMMLSIKNARERGEVLEVDQLCGRAILYVEAHTVKSLREYADFLDSQQPDSGMVARAKAGRMAQVKIEQSRATKPTSWYLGFVPWDELTSFADALQTARRQSEAERVRALASAYKFSQEVYGRRTILINSGKDARGECSSFQ